MPTQLNYVANIICETFRENGLEENYIQFKILEVLQYQTNLESLRWACCCLDIGNRKTFADKIGVTVEMLHTTKEVFLSI